MKPVKRRRKEIEWKRRRYDEANHRQNPPTDRQYGGGARQRRRLKENAGGMTRETNVKTLARTASVAGDEMQTGETNTRWKGGKTHSPATGGSA